MERQRRHNAAVTSQADLEKGLMVVLLFIDLIDLP
jgi:hypothetical protein